MKKAQITSFQVSFTLNFCFHLIFFLKRQLININTNVYIVHIGVNVYKLYIWHMNAT
jgi:hypothetical protein